MLFSGVTYLMPLYLVNSHHLDQFTAGLIMTVPALFSIIVAPAAGSLADRHGSILVSTFAVGLAAAGFLVFATFDPMTVLFIIIAGMLVTRVSTAAFFGPNGKLIMNHCPEGTVGNGSGVMMTVRHIGLVFGIAMFQSVFAIRMYAAGIPRDGTPLVPRLTPALSVARVPGGLRDLVHPLRRGYPHPPEDKRSARDRTGIDVNENERRNSRYNTGVCRPSR